MIYRNLAGEKVSQLGFGAMRLPLKGGKIDEAEAVRMIRKASDSGVNYIDTAWVYHDGESESLVAKAMRDGYRDKYFVATKSPVWLIKKEDDFDYYLDRQLENLQTDRIDFYLLHALNVHNWDVCRKNNAVEFCERVKKAGKIRHFGFSFHDALPLFRNIIDEYPWEFCQIQYNYLDRNEQAGLEGLQYAVNNKTDIIIMEPLRGGNLISPIPEQVDELWKNSGKKRSAAEWALGWIYNHENISVVLSGMSTMEQLEENISIADSYSPGSFGEDDLDLMDKTEELFRKNVRIGCTACRYCMPCPSGVDIPRNFKVWNEYYMFGKSDNARGAWKWIEENVRADKCTGCGACVAHCPQQIMIPDELSGMTADFTG